MKSGCIAGCQYMPSIEFFAHWQYHGRLIVEAHENYQKRSWRNKTAILGNQKPLMLSVPLRRGKHQEMPVKEVEISYDEAWHRKHFQSIQSVYGKTPFFNEVKSGLKEIIFSRPDKLWDLNMKLLEYFLFLMRANWKLELTSQFEKEYPDLYDLRNGVPAGRTQLSISNIPVYEQTLRLGESHMPNLSILDALCHLGPDTMNYLALYARKLHP